MAKTERGMADLRLNGLFEEYRALYELVVFRMTALDRRAPVTAGALLTVAATLDAFPQDAQQTVLLGLPAALLWFVRTTVNNARSFEDVLRRIEEIERAVNQILGCPVMCFQSTHPSRGRQTGGRTGQQTVAAVMATVAVLLAVAACRTIGNSLFPVVGRVAYLSLLALVGGLCVREIVHLKRYRYVPVEDPAQPVD